MRHYSFLELSHGVEFNTTPYVSWARIAVHMGVHLDSRTRTNSTSLTLQQSGFKQVELLHGERCTHEQLLRLSWCVPIHLVSTIQSGFLAASYVKVALYNFGGMKEP